MTDTTIHTLTVEEIEEFERDLVGIYSHQGRKDRLSRVFAAARAHVTEQDFYAPIGERDFVEVGVATQGELVERLRRYPGIRSNETEQDRDCQQAADRIQSLRSEVERLTKLILDSTHPGTATGIRMRAALKTDAGKEIDAEEKRALHECHQSGAAVPGKGE